VSLSFGSRSAFSKGGEASIRSLSVLFLHDLQRSWEKYGEEVLEVMARKYTPAYYAGIVSLARVMRIELGKPGEFERQQTPEEIIDKLEERIGPKGRALFEDFVREINKLQAEQQLEQQRQQEREQRRHAASPSSANGDDPEGALAVAERWRASGAGSL
jgi:hypothetical protein